MESKHQAEENVKAALEAMKKIKPSELSPGFSDRVISSLHSTENTGTNYSYSLLRIAAMFVLILANVWTIRLLFISQPLQNKPAVVSMKDFVSDYQVTDAGDELLTSMNTKHE